MLFGSVYASATPNLSVLTFNILAPCWASPSYYPVAAKPELNRYKRRIKIIRFLKRVTAKVDIIALEEITKQEFIAIKKALHEDYYAFSSYHAREHWLDEIVRDTPWEPNGVALFIKKSRFYHVRRFKIRPRIATYNL